MAKLQAVHVRVNDAATGEPTPCRIRITDADGKYYAPFGRPQVFPSNLYPFLYRLLPGSWPGKESESAYIDGTSEIELPPGRLFVRVEKGIEYQPIEQTIDLQAGKLALRLQLQRAFHPQQENWFSGCLVQTPLSPHEAWLEGAGEGINVINLLAYERETDKRCREKLVPGAFERAFGAAESPGEFEETWLDYPNLLAFSGQRPCVETPGHIVAVNTFNQHLILGSLCLLNSHRVVYPLRFGPGDYPHSMHSRPDNWTLADWCDQCHRKGGLVVGYPYSEEAGEIWADILLGKVDALAWNGEKKIWYVLLSLGYRLPLFSAYCGRPDSRPSTSRVYAKLAPGEEFTYQHWIEAVRAGRSFATSGPFLDFQVDQKPPGAVIELKTAAQTVQLTASAQSLRPFETLEVVYNQRVIHSVQAKQEGNLYAAKLESESTIGESGWVAARVSGPVGAHTSPHYLHVEGQPQSVNAEQVQLLVDALNRTLTWVETQARCETPAQRERLVNIFVAAREQLTQR